MATDVRRKLLFYNETYEKDIREFIDRVTQTVLEYTNGVTKKYDALANYTFPKLYSKYCHATLINSLENLDDFYIGLENELRLQKGKIELDKLVERLKPIIYKGLSMDSGFYALCGKIIVIKYFLLKQKLSFVGEASDIIFEKAKTAFEGCILKEDYDIYRKYALSLLNAVIEISKENPDLYISNIYKTLNWNEDQLPSKEKLSVQRIVKDFTRNRFQTCSDKYSSKFYDFLILILVEYETARKANKPCEENRIFVELSCLALQYKNYFCPEGVEAIIDCMIKVMVYNHINGKKNNIH